MDRRARILVLIVSLPLLGALTWIWSPGFGKTSYQGRSVAYWFRQNLKASLGAQEPAETEYRSQIADRSLNAIKAIGTNALPYLLNQAFTASHDSAVRRLWDKLLNVLPQSWGRPPSTSQDEISHHAVDIICQCRPPAGAILPTLLRHLGGTNVEFHVRALRLLGSTVGPVNEAMPYLTRDIADSNPWICNEAFLALRDPSKAHKALPDLIAYVKTNPQRYPYPLLVIRALGSDAAEAVPALQEVFLATTNSDVRCDLAETLVAMEAHQGGFVVPALLQQFETETNWDFQIRLARAILNLDPSQTLPVRFLTDAWQAETNGRKRTDVRNELTLLFHTNLPSPTLPIESIRFRSPPLERWLALGLGEREVQGVALEQWISWAQGEQPTYRGATLEQWLVHGAPVPSSSDTAAKLAVTRQNCEKAVRSIGTNAIPWLMKWLLSTNLQEFRLSSRGFAILQTNAILAVPALAQLTRTDVPALRARAYGRLDSLGLSWTNTWPALVPTLHNDDLSIRTEAAEYLYRNFPKQAQRAGLNHFVPPDVQ